MATNASSFAIALFPGDFFMTIAFYKLFLCRVSRICPLRTTDENGNKIGVCGYCRDIEACRQVVVCSDNRQDQPYPNDSKPKHDRENNDRQKTTIVLSIVLRLGIKRAKT